MVKSLTVHRNTIERRQRRDVQNAMVRASKGIGESDILAYAIVAIDSDGNGGCAWDTGSALPLWAFADTVRTILDRDIGIVALRTHGSLLCKSASAPWGE